MRPLFVVLVCLTTIACSSSPSPESSVPKECSTGSPNAPADQKACLDKAASVPGAQRTSSGLVYRVITAGSGASPTVSDVVKVNYRGSLIDAMEFDSSYKRNEPATFPLSRVIPCWTEGLQMMKVGGKSQLVCPAAIAYGDAGSPPVIPGGATLVFEVELLNIGG